MLEPGDAGNHYTRRENVAYMAHSRDGVYRRRACWGVLKKKASRGGHARRGGHGRRMAVVVVTAVGGG
jgi:hypothetical protein